MRFFVFAIISFSIITSSASDEGIINDIWLDGNSFYKAHSGKKGRTLYFSEWDESIDNFRKEGSHYLALQLDHSFDPLPYDNVELPGIHSIAAISSNEVIQDYLTFLEQFGRTNGFSYLILPDTTGYTTYEKEVIELAAEKSPQYFIQRSFISQEIPDSKKEFLDNLSGLPQIWVATQMDNLKKVNRWSSRYLEGEHQQFLAELRKARERDFLPAFDIPEALKKNIFEKGIYAIDAESKLPILGSEIVYLGENEKLIHWLSKYVTVSTARKEGLPTIVDRINDPFAEFDEGDILLTLAQFDTESVTQLVFPLEHPGQEILISKMLFGAESINGKNKNATFIPNMKFLSYSDPENEGLDMDFYNQLDSIGKYAISHYAAPGMQLAVVKNGSLIHEKSLGFYTYDSIKSVDTNTIYDLASLTKVMATMPAIAWLIDRGHITLEDSLGQHMSEFVGTNKSGITIRQLLAHNAGLKSYMPFWSMMMDGDRLDAFYYKTPEDEANDIRSYGFEPDPVMLDTLRSFIVRSDLIRDPSKYNYSDLGYMILHLLVERVTDLPFDQLLEAEFYKPMGLINTTFNPIAQGFTSRSIAPTEYDQRFRNYQVWGEVHDRNAAVFGGVSGHAGLFSNATDLAKMMSMFMNGGYYGGRRYLSEEVLATFNNRYFQNNRRGLGWDKKDGTKDAGSKYASDQSFGHTGFTGTMVWADPEQDLIFIFLSNRIYPDSNNNRLGQYNIRTSMHDSIYQSIRSNAVKLN